MGGKEFSNPYREAKDILKEKGWMQGGMGHPDIGFCLMGVFFWDDDMWYEEFLSEIDAVVIANYQDRAITTGPDSTRPLVNFNDNPETTFDDIEAVLDKCAVRWDEQNG